MERSNKAVKTHTLPKVISVILCIIALICALCVSAYLLILKKAFEWSDYEFYTHYTTSDGKYSVILDVSYPPFPPNALYHMRATCCDNASGERSEYTQFEFSVPDNNDVQWFIFEENNNDKAAIIVNHSYGQRIYELVWSDIFYD